jgi:5-methylcytosine-specific restriction endonuclease McrA
VKKRRISSAVRANIMADAEYRCGYCLAPQAVCNWLFEIEHIIPMSAGGSDEEENLWLSCSACNRYKGKQIKARDPRTKRVVRLFNPRRQSWQRHFSWSPDGTRIIGRTACGRATVQALKLNHERAVTARALWRQAGIPPHHKP